MSEELDRPRPTAPEARQTRVSKQLLEAPSRLAGGPLGLQPHSAALGVVAVMLGPGLGLISLLDVLGFSPSFSWAVFFAPLTILVAAAMRPVRRRRRLRAFEQAQVLSLGEARRGERVRISGTARARQPPFATPTGREALVARYLGTFGREGESPGQRVHWELHGQDFDLELADGARVWVRTQHLVFLPDPPPLRDDLLENGPVLATDVRQERRHRGWIYAQEVIAPGDPVDVLGTFDQVVDPAGVGSDRQPRLVPVLVGEEGRPVCVRFSPPPELGARAAIAGT